MGVRVRVLVVEDERDLADAIARGLRRDGYAVDIAHHAAAAVRSMSKTSYDIVCLDLNLPDGDGREVCRRMRSGEFLIDAADMPRVIMLTARDALEDRVAGLDDGADDYLVKPFALAELLARMRALSRRGSAHTGARFTVGAIVLDSARRRAQVGDEVIDLTVREFTLLRYFMAHPGEVLATERLLDHVWDGSLDPFSNTVRVTISKLRRKLATAGLPDAIETIIGSGYRLVS